MSRPSKKSQASDINSLLEKILESKGLDQKLKQYRAWVVWDEVVGPQIAQHAQPLRIRESVLEVRVAHATWMQQLQLLKPKILKELNQRLGDGSLKDIYWKRGEVVAPEAQETPRPVKEKPLSKENREKIEKLAADIEDLDLRKQFSRLMELDFMRNDV